MNTIQRWLTRRRRHSGSGWLPGRSRLHSRQRGQDLIEFGLIVAVVAVLGIAGLSVLGRAEEGYFIPLQNTLSPAAPVGTDDVVHPVSLTMTCTGPSTLIVGGSSTICTFTAVDIWTDKRTWPQGDVALLVNGAPTANTCALTQDTSTPDPAVGTCQLTWSPLSSNAPSAVILGQYNPSDGVHGQVPSNSMTFTVIPGFTTQFTCFDPWVAAPPGPPFQAQVGQPMFCSLKVVDSSTNLPSPLLAGSPMAITAAPGQGNTYLSCFTGSTTVPLVPAAVITLGYLVDPGCKPVPGQPFFCTLQATGLCADTVPGVAQTQFVYRRNYDDSGHVIPTDTLTGTLLTCSSQPACSVTDTDDVIDIGSSVSPHKTGALVNCAGTQIPDFEYARPNGQNQMTTDVTVNATSGSVPCTVSVLDLDPNTAFDYPNCPGGTTGPNDHHCDVDYEGPHSPIGDVTLNVYSDLTSSPMDPITHLPEPSGVGVWAHAGPPVQALSCAGPPGFELGHSGSAPTNIPPHPWGPQFYASWCSQTLMLPSGTWYLDAIYFGGSPEHFASSDVANGSVPALEVKIVVP